jgi:hypothetical protein
VPAGSGKTTTLEGARGKDMRGTAEGDGLVHAAVDTLFELIHAKAVSVGGWPPGAQTSKAAAAAAAAAASAA